MRMKSFLFGAMAVAMMACMTTACSSGDDAKPELVPDPVETQIEYYISGRVTDQQGLSLANVEVKADGFTAKTDNAGKYKLTVTDKKNYELKFTLDGYVQMGEGKVMMPSTLGNRSMVVLNVVLSKEGQEVKLNEAIKQAEAEGNTVVITEKGTTPIAKDEVDEEGTKQEVAAEVAVAVAAGAIDASEGENKVTVTPYIPENDKKETQPTKKAEAAMVNLNIEAEKDIILQAPAAIQVQANVENENYAFKSVKVYREREASRAADWELIGEATYVKHNNSYVFDLKKGDKLNGNYSFRIEPQLTAVINKSRSIKEDHISNAGNLVAIDYDIRYEAPMGWEASFVGNADEAAKKMMLKAIASKENGMEGVAKEAYSVQGKISGDHILFYRVSAEIVEKTYVFSLKGNNVSVKVTVYEGATFRREIKKADQHSGGGLN